MGGAPLPIPWYFFFLNSPSLPQSPSKPLLPHGGSPLHLKMKPPHWKVKSPSRKWFLEKNFKKSETVINIGVSLVHWKKMTGILQKRDFLTWSIQNFVRKKKQFVREYYITWLIDLANKLYDVQKFLDFISYLVFLNILCFKKFCKQTCWIKFNLIASTWICGYLH